MASRFVSEKNIRFLLYEVFDAESLTGYAYYNQHNRKMFDMVVKEALRLAKDLLFPVFSEMDRNPPELVDGAVRVHPAMQKIVKAFADGGWLTSRVPFDADGEQLPHMVADVCDFIFAAAREDSELEAFAGRLEKAVERLQAVTWHQVSVAEDQGAEAFND